MSCVCRVCTFCVSKLVYVCSSVTALLWNWLFRLRFFPFMHHFFVENFTLCLSQFLSFFCFLCIVFKRNKLHRSVTWKTTFFSSTITDFVQLFFRFFVLFTRTLFWLFIFKFLFLGLFFYSLYFLEKLSFFLGKYNIKLHETSMLNTSRCEFALYEKLMKLANERNVFCKFNSFWTMHFSTTTMSFNRTSVNLRISQLLFSVNAEKKSTRNLVACM